MRAPSPTTALIAVSLLLITDPFSSSPRAPLAAAAIVDPPSAAASPSSSSSSRIQTFARDSPYATALLVASAKGAAADWIAQRTEAAEEGAARRRRRRTPEAAAAASTGAPKGRGKESQLQTPSTTTSVAFSYRRNLAFILYGGLYQGAALEYIFNDLFVRLFGTGGSSFLPKVALNQLFVAPFLTLPVAYVVRGGVVSGADPAASLRRYWSDATRIHGGGNVLFAFWKVWTPVNLLLFSIIPSHLRISVNQVFSLLWTVVLSRMSSAKKDIK